MKDGGHVCGDKSRMHHKVVHQISKEDTAVEIGRAPKERIQENCGHQKKLGAAHRRMTHFAAVTWCKGQGKDDVAPRTSKRQTFGRRHQPKPEHKNGIRNRGLRQQLQSKREFTKIYRKTMGLEIVRRIVGPSVRLQKIRNWMLRRGRPPPKWKKKLLTGFT
jgi:hypothetical protein